jgi:PIN domain nuclease of toxin-antitoxin system
LSNDKDNINSEVSRKIFDYSNVLYASSVAVNELILLYKIGKIELSNCKSAEDIISQIKLYDIEIVYYNQYHLVKYIALDLAPDHKDLSDHAIIAQAISDKISLISSDRKFENYVSQGLNFVFNKR